jgi:transcriptional antiterminator RfaH
MTIQWYCFQSKPNNEDFLHGQLVARGIETFYPRLKVKPVNPRARKVRPYFPGYVFIHIDLEQVGASTLHWMPGSVGLVCFDSQPAWVPDSLIHAIRRRVEEINAAGGETTARLQHGDPVRIKEGPFAGYQAIFDACVSGENRVRVFLSLLRRQQLPLELPALLVEPKKQFR